MLLMIGNGIRGRICYAIHQYAKAYNKYMKNHDINKEFLFLEYWNINNLYVWQTSQKFLVDSFKWVENTCLFNEDFIKTAMKTEMRDIFLKLMFYILKNYMAFIMICPFYWKD